MENEGNDTFVTSTTIQTQITAIDEKVTKLENLVWSLYKELNKKIENVAASTQQQVDESQQVTHQIFNQFGAELEGIKGDIAGLTVKSPVQDEGYDGSEEENEYEQYEEQPEVEQFAQGSLDEVKEEMDSQYYSQEGHQDFSRNTVDKSETLIESARSNKGAFEYPNDDQVLGEGESNAGKLSYEL